TRLILRRFTAGRSWEHSARDPQTGSADKNYITFKTGSDHRMCFTKMKAALRGLAAFALSAASTSAFADYTLNMPVGVTDISKEVYDLHMLILWVCVAIGILVFGAMIFSIIMHRKSNHPTPAKWHHHTGVEIVWTT